MRCSCLVLLPYLAAVQWRVVVWGCALIFSSKLCGIMGEYGLNLSTSEKSSGGNSPATKRLVCSWMLCVVFWVGGVFVFRVSPLCSVWAVGRVKGWGLGLGEQL